MKFSDLNQEEKEAVEAMRSLKIRAELREREKAEKERLRLEKRLQIEQEKVANQNVLEAFQAELESLCDRYHVSLSGGEGVEAGFGSGESTQYRDVGYCPVTKLDKPA